MPSSTSQDGSISLSRNQNSSLVNALVIAGAAIVVLWADQYSKHLIVKLCTPGVTCRTIIPNFLRWTFEQNQHGAFGLFGNSAVLLIGMAIFLV